MAVPNMWLLPSFVFCPVYVFLLLWFSFPGSNFHSPSFFFLGCLSGLCYSQRLFFLLFLFLDFFLFLLRYSRSGNAATLARLTNVESSVFPSSDQQRADSLDLGVGNGRQLEWGPRGL